MRPILNSRALTVSDWSSSDDKKMRTVAPLGIRDIHIEHRDWLKHQPDIVVTHHCPLPTCVHPDFAEDLTSAAFASDLTKQLVEQSEAGYWICGHSRIAKRFVIGETEDVMDCCGYHREQVDRFNPGLILET